MGVFKPGKRGFMSITCPSEARIVPSLLACALKLAVSVFQRSRKGC